MTRIRALVGEAVAADFALRFGSEVPAMNAAATALTARLRASRPQPEDEPTIHEQRTPRRRP